MQSVQAESLAFANRPSTAFFVLKALKDNVIKRQLPTERHYSSVDFYCFKQSVMGDKWMLSLNVETR